MYKFGHQCRLRKGQNLLTQKEKNRIFEEFWLVDYVDR